MTTQKLIAYIAGVGMVVGGGFLAKLVDVTAGGALVAAGAFLIGKVGSEWFQK